MKGVPEGGERCKASTRSVHGWRQGAQCARRAVQDGYCNQHHPTTKANARTARTVKWDREFSERSAMHKRVADEATRLRLVDEAAKALLADVRIRYPGEALRCPFMIALDEAVNGGA